MDINPATPGHALVIPRSHSADLIEISDDDLEHTMVAARRLAERMQETLEPDGFNVINACGTAAWQTVFHFHLHVVPRYEDDPLKLPWVPSPGDLDEIARDARADQRRRAAMAEPTITLEREGAVAQVVLSNPPLNLFTDNAFNELMACLDEVEGSDARALVWRADGDIFTGGVDVNGFQRIVDAGTGVGDALAGPLIEGVQRLEALEIPTLALIHGLCLTAGLEIALGCDMIWAERVVEVRAGRGRGRPDAGSRRHAADGRAGRARPRARVRDDRRPLRRRDARALGRGQPGRRTTAPCTRRACAFAERLASGPTKAPRGDEADRPRASPTAGSSAPTRSRPSSSRSCSRPRTCRTRCARSLQKGPGKPLSRGSSRYPPGRDG